MRPFMRMSWKHMGMHSGPVDGCGYNGQLKYHSCDVVGHALDSKHTEASFSPTLTDSLYLQIDQVPRWVEI